LLPLLRRRPLLLLLPLLRRPCRRPRRRRLRRRRRAGLASKRNATLAVKQRGRRGKERLVEAVLRESAAAARLRACVRVVL
jgi:hypothetical protein